ncbi:hypothetical protein CUC15_05870 [Oceanobacillus zhaokaii]|uniref:Uncharacterized protein n=1 Tax=Oceanobacillus zhaokaii TaxID=2052660 RepID=A0A345PEP2_9BACI|nr:hypothetical protein [Oceanobacillus zhaokaii]AXI08472.1 hypothetical protein CUC15_05870 [Oceanobacillus zhaokaii]
MEKSKQLVIPLDGLIKFKERSTRLILKYKLTSALVLTGLIYYFLLITNNLHTVNNLLSNEMVSVFKNITYYILPWGIFYCLVQITRKIK